MRRQGAGRGRLKSAGIESFAKPWILFTEFHTVGYGLDLKGAKMAKRLAKDDWLMLGFAQLATEGVEAIRLDALCAAAGVTKGSFYHHFGSHENYVETLIDTWADWADPEALDYLDDQTSPLEAMAAVSDPMIERGVRRLAAVDETARETVERVDQERLSHLTATTGSQLAAEIGYAAYVGLQHIGALGEADVFSTRIAAIAEMMAAAAQK